jgi:hypothetical protein
MPAPSHDDEQVSHESAYHRVMDRITPRDAVEVTVSLEDTVLEVRYLGAGERYLAPDGAELVRVTKDGGVVASGTFGLIRVTTQVTSAPVRRDLAPRIDGSAQLASLISLLVILCSTFGMSLVGPRVRSLKLDDEVLRRTRVELHPPRQRAVRPSTRTTARTTEPRFEVVHANPFAEGQAWVGSYVCPQGRTALALRIEAVHGDAIQALFDFDFGGGRAMGRFELHGTFTAASGEATFEPGAWLLRPPGYYSVGMKGRVSRTVYEGAIVGAGCDGYTLRLR